MARRQLVLLTCDAIFGRPIAAATQVGVSRHAVVPLLSQCPHITQQQRQQPFYVSVSSYSTTTPVSMGLDEFRDEVSREVRSTEIVGRSWTVHELRRKNFDDLHKLWYVLYKEQNMLLTENHLSKRKTIVFPQSERRRKVKKSMAAIRTVLGERKRDYIAQHALKQSLSELSDNVEEEEEQEEESGTITQEVK